ncbi:MAG: cupin domain-containing protein [Phycisphaerales bacterium JB038]
MLIRRPEETPATPVDMEGVKNVDMRLMIGRADNAPNFAMRHFTVGPGGHSPRHQHDYEHEVYILAGEGKLEYNDTFHPLKAGDVVYVEPNAMHQFTNTGDTDFQFFCFVPISFDCGKPTPGS